MLEVLNLEDIYDKSRMIIFPPADLTVSKRPGTSYRIEIHFAVFNHLYLLFSVVKLVETL